MYLVKKVASLDNLAAEVSTHQGIGTADDGSEIPFPTTVWMYKNPGTNNWINRINYLVSRISEPSTVCVYRLNVSKWRNSGDNKNAFYIIQHVSSCLRYPTSLDRLHMSNKLWKQKTCNFDHQFQKIPSCDVNILLGGGFNSFKTESAKFKPFPTRAEKKKNYWNHHPNSTLRLPRQTDALVSTSWFKRLVSPTNSNKCLPCCDFLQPSDPKHWF